MAPSCQNCSKTAPEITLKKCAKCQSTPYCSRDCQKADWKNHRKVCGKAQETQAPKSKPFTRLGNKVWLHDRPESETYELLIDAYRLRVWDDNNAGKSVNQSSEGFQRFLDTVQTRPGLLPPWWTQEKRDVCEALGRDSSHWCNLSSPVTKSSIIQRYGDDKFPMQLRMFAEQVLGSGPGGQSGKAMLAMMVRMEGGELAYWSTTHVSVA
ncbi:hypothetical protein MKX07_003111 [Trichoderma sp. CBMAI-0711]|uniref:MYND zinc finger protein n=1 Tax=Trichoderma parareesei TaxID=858221 RepID=A0A2H2Z3H2_TRIPA|nr:hypothetical protein MKX07_003111 [Trichoderma sp. CBMAI-0711]OTA01118.1 MYND zinc finger protein [Trichoderma parareesei]